MSRRRKYRRVEREYVVDYVINKFPNRLRAYFNLRIGPPPQWLVKAYPGLPKGYYASWQRYADAIVITDTGLYVIEAKIHHPKVGPAYLIEYSGLIGQTPELKPYLNRPVHLRLVMPVFDPWVAQTCKKHNIEYDIYCPDWIKPFLREKGYII